MEVYNLPVKLRNWFIKRLMEQKEFEKNSLEKAHGKSENSTAHDINKNHPMSR